VSDAYDARSVAVVALHAPALTVVRPADHVTVCRLLAKHHTDVARWPAGAADTRARRYGGNSNEAFVAPILRLVDPADVEDPFTPRQREIVEPVANGLSDVEIAERLYISRRTVESYLEHVKQRLGHETRNQVTAWALSEAIEESDVDARGMM
jgi:DNA-binding NarL/FixJ family response regulator